MKKGEKLQGAAKYGIPKITLRDKLQTGTSIKSILPETLINETVDEHLVYRFI